MTPRQAKLGVDVFGGAVIVSVAFALAGLTWRIAGDPGTGVAVSPPATAFGGPVDLAPIIALAPFGSAVVAESGAGNQPMQLHGILLATPIEASSVLIAINNAPPTAFRIGQAVGGSTIESIAIDHVILRTADGTQALAFPQRSGGAAAGSAVANTGNGTTGAAPASGTVPTGVAAIRALIPESARGDPAPTTQNNGSPAPPPSPTPSGGSAILDTLGATATPGGGYLVGPSASPAMQAAGVRPGDVIERINGKALGNSGQAQQLISEAMASGSARVEIMRNGQRVSLSVPLR